jgi:hypothetical protein
MGDTQTEFLSQTCEVRAWVIHENSHVYIRSDLPGEDRGEGSRPSGTAAGTLAERAARAAQLAAAAMPLKGLAAGARPAGSDDSWCEATGAHSSARGSRSFGPA